MTSRIDRWSSRRPRIDKRSLPRRPSSQRRITKCIWMCRSHLEPTMLRSWVKASKCSTKRRAAEKPRYSKWLTKTETPTSSSETLRMPTTLRPWPQLWNLSSNTREIKEDNSLTRQPSRRWGSTTSRWVLTPPSTVHLLWDLKSWPQKRETSWKMWNPSSAIQGQSYLDRTIRVKLYRQARRRNSLRLRIRSTRSGSSLPRPKQASQPADYS